jgi:uroporphyrinogen decarboxylase
VGKFGLDGFGIDFLPPLFVKVKYGKRGREFIADGLLTSNKALKLVTLPDPTDEFLYEPARTILEGYGNEYAVHARIRLGVSPALLSMGIEGFSYALQDNPALIERVLDIYADWSAELVKHLSKLGFVFLWAFDDIAYNSGPMFSPSVFREIFLPRMKKVAMNIKVPWVYHSDGNFLPIMDDLLTLEMDGLHPIQPDVMNIVKLKRDYGDKVCLLGNIDVGLLTKGTPSEVEKEVKEKIKLLAPGGGYILTSGNSIPSYCKPKNVLAMIRAVHKYG